MLLFVVGVLFFNTTFFIYSFTKTYVVFQLEKEVVEELKKIESDAPIYAFYVDQSFSSYDIKNEVHNFYMEDFSKIESGSLVIFNEEKFAEQWKNHRVMQNWKMLTTNYQLDTLATLSDNWQIYLIK